MLSREELGKRIRTVREELKISASQLGLGMDAGPGYISGIERGRSYPSMEKFLKMCDCMYISPAWIFDTDSDNPLMLSRLEQYFKFLSDEEKTAVLDMVRMLARNKENSVE